MAERPTISTASVEEVGAFGWHPARVEDHRGAVDAAARFATRFALSRKSFTASVDRVDVRRLAAIRVLYEVEHREVMLRVAASTSTASAGANLPVPGTVDPWAAGSEHLAARTRQTCVCPQCRGAKQLTCGSCRGTKRAPCQECGGRGRVASPRGTKVCPKCREKGDVKCKVCKSGSVNCTTCAASGCVDAWLDIERKTSRVVLTSAAQGPGVPHPRFDDASDFDSGQNRLYLTKDDRLEPGATSLPSSLTPRVDPKLDRISSVRVQRFEVPGYRVHFALPFGPGYIELTGTPPVPVGASDTRVLALRCFVLVAATIGALGAASLTHALYAERHLWFQEQGTTGALAALLTFAALAVVAVFEQFTVPLRARSKPRLLGCGVVAVGALALAGVAFQTCRPTLAAARAALTSGDLRSAELEADAVRELGDDPTKAAEVSDDVQLAQIERGASLDEQLDLLRRPWRTAAGGKRAVEVLASRVLDVIARGDANQILASVEVLQGRLPAFDSGALPLALLWTAAERARVEAIRRSPSPSEMAALLRAEWKDGSLYHVGLQHAAAAVRSRLAAANESELIGFQKHYAGLDAELAHDLEVQLASRRCADCMVRTDLSCAVEQLMLSLTLAPAAPQTIEMGQRVRLALDNQLSDELARAAKTSWASARLERLEAAAHVQQLRERVGAPSMPAAAKLNSSISRARRDEERDRKRLAREVAAADAAAKRKEQARRRAELEASRGLLCCDGTLSPTCSCHGSHRGCCSHHGGVCGCERLD